MTLREALKSRGEDEATIDNIMEDLISQVSEGCDPEQVLFDEGLEPDYVFDLLEEMV